MNYLALLRQYFISEKEKLIKTISNEKTIRDGSPSAMQSHHDTTRNQTEKLIQALELQLKELEHNIKLIPQTPPSQINTVEIWSLAKIRLRSNDLVVLLVPSGLGGKKLANFQTIAEDSVLGKIILGKGVNTNFEINGNEGKIVKIG